MQDPARTSLQYLKSVGPKRAKAFAEVGLNVVEDLFFYFPTKYLDRSKILSVGKLLEFVRNGFEGQATIIGSVQDKKIIRYGKKQIMKVVMESGGETFECIWFQGIKYFKDVFNIGESYAVSGKPSLTRYGHLQIVHPDFDRLEQKETDDFLNTGKIIPFYKLPQKFKSANIGTISLRRIIKNALELYLTGLRETLPEFLISQERLLNIREAVKNVHFPSSEEKLRSAWRRFKFEELFYFELLVAIRKYRVKNELKGISFEIKSEPIKKFLDSLPFDLTSAQLRALHEIRKDMESAKPMNRLLQGDVGSGKTIVSVVAMLIAATNDYQSVLMAPTEILADQHYRNIGRMLQPLGIRTVSLVGGQKKREREETLQAIESGEAQIIIGTHALFEEPVKFKKLGLVVIDEQHRFGVEQRAKLIKKGTSPDVLIASATPIPRTLTMTVYGDLDVSIIDEMPRNRKPVKTFLRGESKLPAVYDFIKKKIEEGEQAFVVFPLVEESDKMELKAAEEYFKKFKNNYFKNYKVGLIHGKMNWKEKEEVMLKFAEREFDILVATTVIEVGIDIPNANIILINDAFRFGLSQLHQLRGRVGRGNKQGYCILVAKDKYLRKIADKEIHMDYLSPKERERYKTFIRLNALEKTTNGFELSEIDLKLRGPGNIFGTEQSGFPMLKYADIIEDSELLKAARLQAFNLIARDPHLEKSENGLVKKILTSKYSRHLEYSKIA
jgi:ATP-dependent DNA helicase RecG